MIRGKFILLTIFIAVFLTMSGCSGTAMNSNSSAVQKDSKPAPKLSKKAPVDDLFLAQAKENIGTEYTNQSGGYSGYMDRTGKIVLDLRKGLEWGNDTFTPARYGKNKNFLKLRPFSEELAGFCVLSELKSNGDYNTETCGGFIDKTGKMVIYPSGAAALSFSEGLAGVQDFGEKWGFIDKTGNKVINPQYEYIGSFHNGLAIVGNADYKFGYIDKTGKSVVEMKYQSVSDFSDGFAVVEDTGGFSIIDTTGKEVKKIENVKSTDFPDDFSTLQNSGSGRSYYAIDGSSLLSSFNDGLMVIERAENNYAFIDTTGKVIFPVASPYIKLVGQSNEGFVPVKYSDAETERLKSTLGADRVADILECNFLDAEGKSKFTFKGDITPFSEGLAGIINHKEGMEDRWEFINTSFETVIQPRFEKISPFEGGLSWVKVKPEAAGFEGFKDTNWEGYIDTTGKPIVPQWQ